MKSFNQLLADLNDGSTLAGLTGDLAELLQTVQNTGRAGSIKFWYELDRVERAIEDAFAGYVGTLRETSGYQVLLGTP